MSERERREPRRLTRTASSPAPLSTVRDEVRHAIEQASVRAVAREVGLSPSGLQKFADGSQPYRGTRRKLVEWYAKREAGSDADDTPPAAAAAAFELLLRPLPPHRRADARRDIIEVLRAACASAAVAGPRWLQLEEDENERGRQVRST